MRSWVVRRECGGRLARALCAGVESLCMPCLPACLACLQFKHKAKTQQRAKKGDQNTHTRTHAHTYTHGHTIPQKHVPSSSSEVLPSDCMRDVPLPPCAQPALLCKVRLQAHQIAPMGKAAATRDQCHVTCHRPPATDFHMDAPSMQGPVQRRTAGVFRRCRQQMAAGDCLPLAASNSQACSGLCKACWLHSPLGVSLHSDLHACGYKQEVVDARHGGKPVFSPPPQRNTVVAADLLQSVRRK